MDTERAVAVSHLTFLRGQEKRVLYRSVPSLDALLRLSRDDIGDLIGRPLKTRGWDPARLGPRVARDVAFLEQRRVSLLTFGEPSFPPWLTEIYDPPFLLFVVGNPVPSGRTMLAVVGTRTPTPEGRTAARALGLEVAAAGVPLVSGLARGIDTAAHRGAVAGRGETVAVLGCGIDMIYPAQNRVLAEEIVLGGGSIISEYPPGTPPRQFNFPERNRIISGLSRGTVVVEAPERSGALITADYALEQGRDLFVHRVAEASPRGAGARALLADGAAGIGGMEDIMREWDLDAAHGVEAWDRERTGAEAEANARPASGYPGAVGVQLALELEAELAGGSHD
ncbi:MAG: DNA-processing protein DprA [Spirochaetaceae bacterium]